MSKRNFSKYFFHTLRNKKYCTAVHWGIENVSIIANFASDLLFRWSQRYKFDTVVFSFTFQIHMYLFKRISSEKPPVISLKWYSVSKIVLTFHCSNKLPMLRASDHKIANSWHSASNLQTLFPITSTLFSNSRSEQFSKQNTQDLAKRKKKTYVWLFVRN